MSALATIIKGSVLFVLSIALGIGSALAGFFGASVITDSVLGLSVIGLTLCFLVSTAIALRAARHIFPAHPKRVGLVVGIGTTLFVIGLASFTVFRPLAVPAEQTPLPPQASYWELTTGSRIAYLRVPAKGTAKATPIIRVHGGPGGYAVANPNAVAYFGQLALDGYEVYFYDQTGSGFSTRLGNPRDYTFTRSIQDLEAIRQKIGAEQVILIGESWGGTIVSNYMAAYPEQVAKVIFTSPAPINPREWKTYQDDIRLRLTPEQQRKVAALTSSPRLMALMMLMRINPSAAYDFAGDREMDSWMDQFLTGEIPALICKPADFPAGQSIHGFGFWAGKMVGREFYEKTSAINPRMQLLANPTPVLILRGECDHIKWQVVDEYRKTFPKSTLLYFPEAGHIIYYDRPDLYLAAVRAFLLDRPLPLPPHMDSAPPGSSRQP